MHLHIILVGNQLDAVSSTICLTSTCFEQLCAHPQEDNCINTSGIITLRLWPSGMQVKMELPSWPSNKHIIEELVRQFGYLPEFVFQVKCP